MRFRLDGQHYIDDKLLEAGTEIGDGTPVPYRYEDGKPRPPSRQMVPLDDEAKAAWKETFETEGPVERDPTKPIPIQGKPSSDPVPPRAPPPNPAKYPSVKPDVINVKPSENPSSKDPAGEKNPAGFAESKDLKK